MESVPLSSRILHSLPDSSEGIMAAVDPGRHSVTRARDLIKRHLPPRFIFNMLKSRFKEDQFSTNSMVAFTFPFMPDAGQDNIITIHAATRFELTFGWNQSSLYTFHVKIQFRKLNQSSCTVSLSYYNFNKNSHNREYYLLPNGLWDLMHFSWFNVLRPL